MVEALPNLLLLSLALFFAALISWLWEVSRPVARVVLVFTVVGASLYAASMIAGAIYDRCPYKTTASTSALSVMSRMAGWAHKALHMILPGSATKFVHDQAQIVKDYIIVHTRNARTKVRPRIDAITAWFDTTNAWKEGETKADPTVCAQSVLWMLDIGTEDDQLHATADYLPLIDSQEDVQMIAKSYDFSKLLTAFRRAVLKKKSEGPEDQDQPLQLCIAGALAHVFAADPMRCATSFLPALQGLPITVSAPDATALQLALVGCCRQITLTSKNTESSYEEWPEAKALRSKTLIPLRTLLALGGDIERMKQYNPNPSDDKFICLFAFAIVTNIYLSQLSGTPRTGPDPFEWDKHLKSSWRVKSGYASVCISSYKRAS